MYLKSPDEMATLFSAYPEAVKATLEIAEKCRVSSCRLDEPMLPSFKVPEGYDTEGLLPPRRARGAPDAGSKSSDAQDKHVDGAAYGARLETELDVIAKMKFAGYFLIVWDFIRHAKESGIPVGPGRGSGAGSLVAYAMRITDLDPIPYNLLFERFLNPERVSMPDFDIDFCMDRRDEVIAYVQQKYGETSVGQIATFAELKSKSVVKDVARCLGITPTEAQQIANLIPRKTPAETYTIAEASRSSRSSRRCTRRDRACTRAARPGSRSSRASRGTPASTPPASSSAKARSGTTCRSSATRASRPGQGRTTRPAPSSRSTTRTTSSWPASSSSTSWG